MAWSWPHGLTQCFAPFRQLIMSHHTKLTTNIFAKYFCPLLIKNVCICFQAKCPDALLIHDRLWLLQACLIMDATAQWYQLLLFIVYAFFSHQSPGRQCWLDLPQTLACLIRLCDWLSVAASFFAISGGSYDMAQMFRCQLH